MDVFLMVYYLVLEECFIIFVSSITDFFVSCLM